MPFANLVEVYSAEVFELCCQSHPSRVAAEDAWVETFLAAIAQYPTRSLHARNDPKRWLMSLVLRSAADASALGDDDVQVHRAERCG
jgi:DNA-directed RNA polymerase specialized sigma24 family protein